MIVEPNLIRRIVGTWEDPRTQNIIEAIEDEIKNDIRHARREEEAEFLTNLRGQIHDQSFWECLQRIVGYEFRF